MQRWRGVPFVSAALVIINVIVFIVCTFTGDLLYNMGELGVHGVTVLKEYDRIVWAMFLHIDVDHIFNNMVILFFLGAMIEKEIGHIRYGIFYLLSGIGGNIISLMYKIMTNETAVTVGASGAVFGLDGVLLALVLFSKRRMENVTPARVFLMIAYSLYNGFRGANIDNAAHIGGLGIGFVLGLTVCVADKAKVGKNDSRRRNIEY